MMNAQMTSVQNPFALADDESFKMQMVDFDPTLNKNMRQCTICSQWKKISDFPTGMGFRKSLECSVCVLLKKSGFDCMPCDVPDVPTKEFAMDEERTPPSPTNVAKRSSLPSPAIARSIMKRLSWNPVTSPAVTANSSEEDQTPPVSPAATRRNSASPTIAKSFKKRLSWNSSSQTEIVPDAMQEHSAPAPGARRGSLPSPSIPRSMMKKRMSWTSVPAPPEMVQNSGAHYA